jgi:hypothetical protein
MGVYRSNDNLGGMKKNLPPSYGGQRRQSYTHEEEQKEVKTYVRDGRPQTGYRENSRTNLVSGREGSASRREGSASRPMTSD